MADLYLEIRFALRDRGVLLALAFAFLITTASVVAGTWDIYEQRAEIDALTEETAADQQHTLSLQADAGSAAYGVHHFTYQPPSPLAFAAQGTRGELPWQHRVRMLALEGQIYEADTGNPELTLLGRLDFAFVAAILLPLILILLLYDLDARERRDGRYELLSATSAGATNALMVRAAARALLLFAVVTLPFVSASLLNQASIAQSMATDSGCGPAPAVLDPGVPGGDNALYRVDHRRHRVTRMLVTVRHGTACHRQNRHRSSGSRA